MIQPDFQPRDAQGRNLEYGLYHFHEGRNHLSLVAYCYDETHAEWLSDAVNAQLRLASAGGANIRRIETLGLPQSQSDMFTQLAKQALKTVNPLKSLQELAGIPVSDLFDPNGPRETPSANIPQSSTLPTNARPWPAVPDEGNRDQTVETNETVRPSRDPKISPSPDEI